MNFGLLVVILFGSLIFWQSYGGAGSTRGATFMMVIGLALVIYGLFDRFKK